MRCEPSPPIFITQSTPTYSSVRIISSERSTISQVPSFFFTGQENGPPLFVVSIIVPPLKCIPRTTSGVRRTISEGSHSTPLKAWILPSTSQSFSCSALFTIARITALRPGQSPPPVATNTRFILILFLFISKRSVRYKPHTSLKQSLFLLFNVKFYLQFVKLFV